MGSAEAKQWHEACTAEYDGLVSQGTWVLVDLPPGRKTIKSKWVFKVRHNSDGEIERYKARLVAKGFMQEHGIDFDEYFSLVVKMTTLRSVLALVAIEDLNF